MMAGGKSDSIKVMLVDDHEVVLEGLSVSWKNRGGFRSYPWPAALRRPWRNWRGFRPT